MSAGKTLYVRTEPFGDGFGGAHCWVSSDTPQGMIDALAQLGFLPVDAGEEARR